MNTQQIATLDRHDTKVSILERLRGVFGELFTAVSGPDEHIRRASDLLRRDPELHRLVMPEAPDGSAQDLRVRGGFTARKKRLLKIHIEEHLDGALKNADLAVLAGLSESLWAFGSGSLPPPFSKISGRITGRVPARSKFLKVDGGRLAAAVRKHSRLQTPGKR